MVPRALAFALSIREASWIGEYVPLPSTRPQAHVLSLTVAVSLSLCLCLCHSLYIYVCVSISLARSLAVALARALARALSLFLALSLPTHTHMHAVGDYDTMDQECATTTASTGSSRFVWPSCAAKRSLRHAAVLCNGDAYRYSLTHAHLSTCPRACRRYSSAMEAHRGGSTSA